MDNKKSKIFANKIEKEINNNKKFYYSNAQEKEEKHEQEKTIIENNENINKKINSIFSSTYYVYKADVIIKLKDKEIKTNLIGKNSTHLITLDNELIPINDIIDIEYNN